MSTPTPESLKEKAKVIRKFLAKKYNVDVSHGHCLDLISELFGFKDWNTASAGLKPTVNQDALPDFITTAGDMRRALEPFKDSAVIEAWSDFKIEAFGMAMAELDVTEGTITTAYSFIRGECGDDKVSFQLKTEREELYSTDGKRIM